MKSEFNKLLNDRTQSSPAATDDQLQAFIDSMTKLAESLSPVQQDPTTNG